MDLTTQLKNSVQIEQVVNRLGINLPIRSADSLLGNCPTGHPSKSGQCFGVNINENYFNCFSCGKAGDIFALVEIVNNCDFKTALHWLTNEFRPDLTSELSKATPQHTPKQQKYYQRADFFKTIYEYGKELLSQPVAIQELDYLVRNRGYDPELLKQSDWIYFPPDQELKQHLRQKYPAAEKEINELKLQGFYGDNFRLAFPYRDRYGRITTFVKRSTSPAGVSVFRNGKTINARYDSTPGTGTKHDLFNLNNCRKQNTLIVVEGYPDALYFHTLGMNNVVAVGQGLLSKTHLEGLTEFGVENVIIAFDNDPPKIHHQTGLEVVTGVENTDKAVQLLSNTKIKSFVLVPGWYQEHKDPDEFVKAHGIDAFRKLTEGAISSTKWAAYRLFDHHKTQTDLGRETATQEAFSATLSYSNIDREQYLSVVAEKLNLTDEYMAEQLELLHKENDEKRVQKEFQDYFQKGVDFSKKGELVEIEQLLKQRKHLDLKSLGSSIPSYNMEQFVREIQTTAEGLKTGFAGIDDNLVIPNDAMTIIAGRPSHGKTTLMLNMLLNMVEMYPDKSFLFFTYEEPRKQLVLKMLNILANTVVDEKNNQKMLGRYIRGDNSNNKKIESAKSKLNEYLTQGRLWVVDERKTGNELMATLEQFAVENDIGAVYIDYIQKIPSTGQFGTRQLELQRTSGTILEAATTLHIPIILGAQLNRAKGKDASTVKLDTLREAGDIEQDANLVLAIYNEAMDELLSDGDVDLPDTVPLSIQVLKNRNGVPMVQEYLQFKRSTLLIRDNSFLHVTPRLAA